MARGTGAQATAAMAAAGSYFEAVMTTLVTGGSGQSSGTLVQPKFLPAARPIIHHFVRSSTLLRHCSAAAFLPCHEFLSEPHSIPYFLVATSLTLTLVAVSVCVSKRRTPNNEEEAPTSQRGADAQSNNFIAQEPVSSDTTFTAYAAREPSSGSSSGGGARRTTWRKRLLVYKSDLC